MPISVIQPNSVQQAVSYAVSQSLTTDQQATARNNIKVSPSYETEYANENILYNSNFLQAIHQEYDTIEDLQKAYILDGWKFTVDDQISATLQETGLLLTAQSSVSQEAMLIQPIEPEYTDRGYYYYEGQSPQIFTTSLVYSNVVGNVTLVYGYYNVTTQKFVILKESDVLTNTNNLVTSKVSGISMNSWTTFNKQEGQYGFVGVRLYSTDAKINLIAIKHEKGSTQTLWRKYLGLNSLQFLDDPDPQKQLLRCQRYYVKWKGRTSSFNNYIGPMVAKTSDKNQMRILINLPTVTRVKPACTISGIVADSFAETSTEVTLQDIAWGTIASDNYIMLLNLPQGSTFADTDLSVRFKDNNSYVIFDARI